jgi:hypothetical protein
MFRNLCRKKLILQNKQGVVSAYIRILVNFLKVLSFHVGDLNKVKESEVVPVLNYE